MVTPIPTPIVPTAVGVGDTLHLHTPRGAAVVITHAEDGRFAVAVPERGIAGFASHPLRLELPQQGATYVIHIAVGERPLDAATAAPFTLPLDAANAARFTDFFEAARGVAPRHRRARLVDRFHEARAAALDRRRYVEYEDHPDVSRDSDVRALQAVLDAFDATYPGLTGEG